MSQEVLSHQFILGGQFLIKEAEADNLYPKISMKSS